METTFDFSFFLFQNQKQKSDYGLFSRFFDSAPRNGKFKHSDIISAWLAQGITGVGCQENQTIASHRVKDHGCQFWVRVPFVHSTISLNMANEKRNNDSIFCFPVFLYGQKMGSSVDFPFPNSKQNK